MLECRMYEPNYPEVDTVVMVKITSVAEMGAYVNLVEYNNAEGLILLSELCRRRIRSVSSVVRVGSLEPAMVLSVDLYIHVGWPLYRKYGHAYEAFKLIVTEPDSILNSLTREVKESQPRWTGGYVTKMVLALSDEVKDALIQNIRRRMTPQTVKIRADVVLTCFEFDGVLHIKEAIRKAEAASNKDCPVKVQLVAAPLYVFTTTHTLDKEQGILVLTNAVEACAEVIKSHGGELKVKEQPRAVNERDAVIAYEEEEVVSLEKEVAKKEYSEVEEDIGGMEDVE
ncbi:hypothetical protein AQUCO_01400348v1 [Aquilegia coerulea]|uniref:S1 motif domain-containing protein n=1 Tax=Aquilegia coerulea TaxID=218851 RepID=A0A2G5DVZ7_AQUCA|nr:hypothetical protein AQUCO_01400348v1 [Aquilegia coerulea]